MFRRSTGYGFIFLFIILMINPLLMVGMAQEVDLHLQDSDEDGISDWDEINRYESNPNSKDSDGDTIDDYREVTTGTSPNDEDSDGDGFPDEDEYDLWIPGSPIPECWYRCPYIADLPELTTTLTDNRILTHYTFVKGDETHEHTIESTVTGNDTDNSWKLNVGYDIHAWAKVWTQVGFSTKIGTMFEVTSAWEAKFQAGVQANFDHGTTWTWNGANIDHKRSEDKDVFDDYTKRNWDYSTANLHINATVRNSYSREVRLDSAVFDLIIGNQRYSSETWSPSKVFGPGEEFSVDLTFTLTGEEWIEELTRFRKMNLEVNTNSVEMSVLNDATNRFESEDTMNRRVWDRCALIYIAQSEWGPIRKYITAHVDKLDGINVLEVLDRLYLPYTYRYGRMMSLCGIDSAPGEEVWTFAYQRVWYDPETYENETSFVDLQMRNRGALLLNLDRDTDGDWLTDDIEKRIGTDWNLVDTDGDYLDDYVEVVLAGSNPFLQDTDGGGTSDGIEYYEGLDPNDPTDDILDPPNWYKEHLTIQTAKHAADILLRNAIYPTDDQLYWPSPQSPSSFTPIDYSGIVSYVTNETIRQDDDDTISSLHIGDIDGDDISEIVIGTYPNGKVILLTYNSEDEIWENETIAVLGNSHPVRITDVFIGDADNVPGNEIVVGTWYNDGVDKGEVLMFYKSGQSWYSVSITETPLSGGVYSIDIGNTCGKTGNVVAVGQGATISSMGSSVIIYYYQDPSWLQEIVATTTSSRIHVDIGDFVGGLYAGNELVYCSYALNSTLGFVGYNGTHNENIILKQHINLAGDPPPYEMYMYAEVGNRDGIGGNELIYAVDSSVLFADRIEARIGSGYENVTTGLEFACPQLAFDDFDNDGSDEVIFHTLDSLPQTNVSVCGWDGLTWSVTFIENATEPYVSAISAGDVDTDGEIEVLYGTSGSAILRMWDNPRGALWPTETFAWDVRVEHPAPWIYEGESFPVNITASNFGPLEMDFVNITVTIPGGIRNNTPVFKQISNLVVETNHTCSFSLLPMTSGNYTMLVEIKSYQPRIHHLSEHSILVRPRIPNQAQIGLTLLDLARHTNNETLLDAAIKLGNWLETVHLESGNFYAWNGDPALTESLLPGYVQATTQTGMFFLELFRATGNYDFLVDALDAASFLADPYEGNMTVLDGIGLAWGIHENGIVDAAKVAELLIEINEELLYDYFNETLEGVMSYLMFLSDPDTTTIDWLDSCGLTQSLSLLLAKLGGSYSEYASWAANWLSEQVQNDLIWVETLNPGYRSSDPYVYYTGTGLAALCDILSSLAMEMDADYVEEIDILAGQIAAATYMTSQGANWLENSWTSNVTKLARSVDWDYGASGIASALVAAYKVTGNQSYLDLALNATKWMSNSLSVLGSDESLTNITAPVISGIINSMIDIHSTLPVVFVGYFVDPMTSLSVTQFNLSGYVQTIGWHANGINITLDIPSAFRAHGQNRTIEIGSISVPGAVIVDWVISPLAYGEFTIGVSVQSTNAGNQTTDATVAVTDLGVTELSEPGLGFVALSLAQQLLELYNLGEAVYLPIEAEYYNGDPAVNASLKVGGMGTVVVDETGVGRIGITSVDPGTVEIPIYIRYDKTTGITSGTENITIELTFTGLEVYDVTSSAASSFTGELIAMSGYVRYAHDQSIVPSATVSLDGSPVAITDEAGFFQFQYTEGNPGLVNYTITADADADHRIVVCASSQQVQIEWMAFWTPVTIGIAIVSAAAVVVVVTVIVFKKKKIALPARNRLKGIAKIRRKNPK